MCIRDRCVSPPQYCVSTQTQQVEGIISYNYAQKRKQNEQTEVTSSSPVLLIRTGKNIGESSWFCFLIKGLNIMSPFWFGWHLLLWGFCFCIFCSFNRLQYVATFLFTKDLSNAFDVPINVTSQEWKGSRSLAQYLVVELLKAKLAVKSALLLYVAHFKTGGFATGFEASH